MTDDLISREALKEELKKYFPDEVLDGVSTKSAFNQILHDIDNAPTVNIHNYGGQVMPDTLQGWRYEERPQGEWNYIQAGMCVCPFCGAMPHKLYKNYCAKCGADMRGVDNGKEETT